MNLSEYLRSRGIDEDFVKLAAEAGAATREIREEVRERTAINQWKVLEALQSAGLMEGHFFPTTGYGLGDSGREVLDEAVARIFKTEAGCMRWQIASGTHALTAALFGTLRPGKTMLSLTGAPYDTMLPVIGAADKAPGTLAYWGVGYRELPLREDGHIDISGKECLFQFFGKQALIADGNKPLNVVGTNTATVWVFENTGNFNFSKDASQKIHFSDTLRMCF